MGKEEKTPQTVINIQTAYNVNPAATKVENNFFIGSGKEAAAAIREAVGGSVPGVKPVDTTPIRTEILAYVSRVRPLLTEEAKSTFMKMWEDILDLPEVKSQVYEPGKQWGTNFNRDLVANILYYLRSRKIYSVVYKDNYNGAAMCEALEGDRDHSVKHALREDPAKDVRQAIDALLKNKY